MISSKYVPICNRFHGIQDNCGKKPFLRETEVAVLTPACTGLLKLKVLGLGLLKSTFNAENFIRRFSRFSGHFVAVQC